MRNSVDKIPVRYRRPRNLTGKEIWDVSEPPSEMVWEVCPYLRMDKEDKGCQQCPQWEEDERYGKTQRGCYGLASEACRIVIAMQRKLEE